MTSKVKMRARLLKLYKQTGDEEYRNAAEALKVPLIDQLRQLQIISPRRRGRTVGKNVAARLYRMHKLVAGGMKVNAAAEREVKEHGHRFYVTKQSEIDFLRKEYTAQRERIRQNVALCERWTEPARQMLRSQNQMLHAARQCALSQARLLRAAQVSLPQVRHGFAISDGRRIMRSITRPLLDWINTPYQNSARKDPGTDGKTGEYIDAQQFTSEPECDGLAIGEGDPDEHPAGSRGRASPLPD